MPTELPRAEPTPPNGAGDSFVPATLPQRIAAVTTIAVVNLVVGTLGIMVVCFVGFVSLLDAAIADGEGGAFLDFLVLLLAVSLMLSLMLGIPFLFLPAGHGLWRRRQWARALTLALGGFLGLCTLQILIFDLVEVVVNFGSQAFVAASGGYYAFY